tara:strand:- start:4090 stop:5160 length:1071 start_codon:yes stop_codon:yes gene_type:complete
MHNVEKMMFTGKKPWWYGNKSQGTAVGVDLGNGPVTSAEAIAAAGLDWDVDKSPAYIKNNEGEFTEVNNEKFLIRTSDQSILGRCTDQYELFQNREAFTFLDSIVNEGDLLYHTAGSLEEGKRVWILAQTPDSWQVRRMSGVNNTHHAFLLTAIGHDGKSSINMMPTDIRAECANTVGYAESIAQKQSLMFRIPHKGAILEKLELAATAIEVMRGETEERRRILQEFANNSMSTDEFIDFALEVFLNLDGPKSKVKKEVSLFYEEAGNRSQVMMKNKVEKATDLFHNGFGNEGNSSYDALQAFTEYFDHFDLNHVKDKITKGKRAAKAVQNSWMGDGAAKKNLAYKKLAKRVKVLS